MVSPHATGAPAADLPHAAQEFPRHFPRWPASALWRADEPAVRRIGLGDLREALALGLDDYRAAPTHVLFICLIYPILGLILFRLSFGYEILPLVWPLLAGFTLLGPLLGVVLYEMSRRRERGLALGSSRVGGVIERPSRGAIARLGIVLLAVFTAWMWTSRLMYDQIVGGAVPASPGEFARQIVSTGPGWQLIIAGTSVGFVFALVVLVTSVVSFPMLVDRNVSATTAVRTSIRAVIENPVVMAAWGLIVVGLLALGAAPLFLGLAVVLPVLGHATWHLYRRLVQPEAAPLP